MSGAIGIDLGTTNSCVGYYDRSKQSVEICSNEYGQRTTASVVAFTDQEKLIGEAAIRQQSRNPTNTLYETKRFIGRSFQECAAEVRNYPYKAIDLGEDNVNFHVKYHEEDRIFCPEEIAAIILDKMRSVVEQQSGTPVTQAVISVPAYFNDAQRQATRDAGKIAGLEVLRIINEPTCAAIAYGIDKQDHPRDINVLIFDLGGGTFDVSLLTLSTGVFEVRAISGDCWLGGSSFDQRIMDYVEECYQKQFGVDMNSRDKPKLRKRLRSACEKAKCDLSGIARVEIELDGIAPDGDDFSVILSRGKFEELCDDLFKRCMQLVKVAVQEANLTTGDIDEVVLVGGSTRILKVQSMLSKEFGGKDLCKSIDPDLCVAYGAAIQASILAAQESDNAEDMEHVPDICLIDVCPLSLGVETVGGLNSVVISRNSIVPVKKSKLYSTTDDNQTSVSINVYEGERASATDNRLLGSFELEGIRPAPRGAPKIRVSFELDADGIFRVSATDESEVPDGEETENRTRELTIQNNKGRLSDEEVNKFVADAESHAARDEIFAKTIRLKTDFENLLYGIRRTFTETAKDILEKHADKDTVKMVLDVVDDQFDWLSSLSDKDCDQSVIDEILNRRDYVENDVARNVVDAINQHIRENSEEVEK
jgi:heat shock protein 1/8